MLKYVSTDMINIGQLQPEHYTPLQVPSLAARQTRGK